MQEKIGKLML